jgi:transcriptional regulator with XRE-family HTH domain
LGSPSRLPFKKASVLRRTGAFLFPEYFCGNIQFFLIASIFPKTRQEEIFETYIFLYVMIKYINMYYCQLFFRKNLRVNITMSFMKSSSIDFGIRLKTLRRAKGLTQYQLADMLKTSQRMIAHYERQNNRPRIDKVKAIAEALEISIEELVGTIKPNKKNKQGEASYSIMKRVKVIEKLPLRDQRAIFRLINSLAEKNKIKGKL